MSTPTIALGEVAELARDGVSPEKIKEGTFFVGLENIKKGGGFERVSTVEDGELASTKFAFTPRHVLFGKLRPYLAKVALPDFEGVCSTDIIPILPGPRLDRRFLAHYLLTPKVIALASERATGANLPRLSPKVLLEFPIPMPPLDEQRRIAAILDQAEELRAKRRAAIALLDQLPQAIFLEMFGDPASNPKGWQTKPLKAVTTKIGSGSTPTGGESAYKSEGIALIRSMNIHDGHFVPKGLAYVDEEQAAKLANVVVAPNDVLLNITGASVARVALVPKGVLPARVNQHVSILRCAQELSPRFLESLLINPSTKKSLLRVAGAGATREAITKEQLESFEILLPPTEAQELFAGRVEAISCVKSTHQAALVELDALFASLQAASFSGSTSS